jgi:hypothetical protein
MAGSGYSVDMSGFSIPPSSEQTYALIRTAVISRQPIRALYHERARFCVHKKYGWNSGDRLRGVVLPVRRGKCERAKTLG